MACPAGVLFAIEASEADMAFASSGTAPCLGWEEGLRCVELMEAGYESAKQNGTPIDLPLRPDLELN